MANLLKMAMSETIRTLHRRGWSQRRIADELGINRETVARHLRQADPPAKPAIAPSGSTTADGESKPANAPIGSDADCRAKTGQCATGSDARQVRSRESPPAPDRVQVGRASDCEPWRDVIQAKCDLGLSAQRIYQDLVAEHGFTGSYYSVRRFVRRLEPAHELPFRRMECEPGEEAQVDFGTGAPIVGPDGKRRRTHVFRIVLSHSRKGYSEVGLPADHRGLPPLPGERLLALRRRAQAAGPRQPQGGGEEGRLVRSRAQPQGALLRRALRHRVPADAAVHAAAQGEGRAGVGYVQDNALKGRSLRQPGGAEPLPAATGS